MNKSTLIAIAVFGVLAAAAVATLRQKPERGITRISFAHVEPAKVDRIVVQGPHPVELRKEGDVWKTGDKNADAAAVQGLLDMLPLVVSAEVVTRNPDRFAELEVDEAKGTHVQAYSGEVKAADFVIGSTASGGSHVRVGDAVYVVKRVYKGTFSREPSLWLDRKLFAGASANEAARLEVRLKGQAPYALVKEGDLWKPEDPSTLPADFRFDESAARTLVSSLTSAQAKEILDEDPGESVTGLGDGADTIVLQLTSGDSHTLRIGAEKDGGVYARTSTRSDLFTLPEYLANNLRKPIAQMRDLSLMAFDTSAAKRLEIVKDKERLVFEKEGEVWKVAESTQAHPEGFDLDPTAVTRRLSSLRSLRAVAVADPAATRDTGLDRPTQKASVTLADDRVVTLAFGKETKWEDAEAVYARGNADDKIYLVRPFARDNVLGGLDTFARREQTSPLANLDPEALKNLPPEVRESLMKQIEQEKQKEELIKKIMQQQGKK